MRFDIRQGDLMQVDEKYVICHCISEDCAMGAGVVVPIQKKYTGVRNACTAYAEEHQANGKPVVGTAFPYTCPAGRVYNLFSKQWVHQRAGDGITHEQYHTQLKSCLEDLCGQMLENGEMYLAMPKIACGIDQCRWEDIEKIIRGVFAGTPIEILVCVL